jgi:hypothetical protein
MVIGSLEFKERDDAPEAPVEGRKKLFFGPDGLLKTLNSEGEAVSLVLDTDPRLTEPTEFYDELYYRKPTALALSIALG